MLDAELTAAYLNRLGLEAEPPSADALQRLMHAQVERVPYETMWIAEGAGWGIDPVDAARRVAVESRGGYCYHLNGAFSELLGALGYDVHRHVGGVHGPEGPNEECMGDHLVLTVTDLPADGNPEGVWYVDAGLGDALHDPLPLAAGTYTQDPWTLSVEGAGDGWHLTHDPAGGFTGMAWTLGLASAGDFGPHHQFLSTSPDSGFVKLPIAQRRDADAVDVMRGLMLHRIERDGRTSELVSAPTDWFAALGDLFDLTFEDSAPDARERIWDRVSACHEAWEAAGRP